ncbi:unnamed protein product, partial [Polarella glacialis]
DQPSAASLNSCGAALQGAILGDRRVDGAKLESLMLLDSIPHSLGIEIEGGTMVGLVTPHTPIPTTKVVRLKLVDPSHSMAVLHVREVFGSGSTWLGAVAVPVTPAKLPEQGAALGPEADEDSSGEGDEVCVTVKIEVDVSGLVQLEANGVVSEPLGLASRNAALTAKELTSLHAQLSAQAGDRWAHYGQEASLLPLRTSKALPSAPTLNNHNNSTTSSSHSPTSASTTLWRRRSRDLGAVALMPDIGSSDDEDDSEEEKLEKFPGKRETGDEASDSKALGGGRVDSRGQAYAQRLREKVRDRQKGPTASVKAKAAPPIDMSGDAALWLSSTEVCAVCLCTEAELGRPFCWVLEKCGHKCICKLCLRKIKSKTKRADVECPLCRTVSRPVLEDRYNGEVYTAEAD